MMTPNPTTVLSSQVILGLGIAGVITQFVKLTVGRPRPGISRFIV